MSNSTFFYIKGSPATPVQLQEMANDLQPYITGITGPRGPVGATGATGADGKDSVVPGPPGTPYIEQPITGLTYNGSGQLTGYAKAGSAYTLTYVTIAGLSLPSTKVGGGRTVTYSYNSSGQLLGETFS